MLCKSCKIKVYCQSIITSSCILCGAKITTKHMPGYKVCLKCSEDKKLCQQCGGKVISSKT